MQSMTGFGQAERSFEDMDVAVEVKTVNGRYFDLSVRLPKELASLELALRKEVQAHLRRGRVEVYVNLRLKSSHQYEVNEALVRNYLSLAEKMGSWGIGGALDLSTLFQLAGVMIPRQLDSSSEPILKSILEVLREALDQVVVVRNSEGAVLKADIENRIQSLEKFVVQVAAGTDQIREYHRAKLVRRLNGMDAAAAMDENRLTQEIFLYAERSDISEEIIRLRSHLDRFRQYLAESDREASGRSLNFLCQEMNREMNTILSKSPLVEISAVALEGRSEIEKIREQVQNVE